VYVIDKDWDGVLPELLGFGGISVKQGYKKEVEPSKKLSFDLIIPETGTLVVDSSYYPPAGEWYYSSPQDIERLHKPSWGGPYTFKVIK